MVRKPAVAGMFYPGSKTDLSKMLDLLFKSVDKSKIDTAEIKKASGFVAPHAGYEYSGYVAAYTYSALLEYAADKHVDTFVIVGPNHMGYADFVTVSLEDWETPLGIAKNDTEFSKEVSVYDKRFSTSESEIAEEHSIEVQVPFIQHLFQEPKFAFICMSDQGAGASKAVCDAVLSASKKLGRRIAFIASSDFDHYEPASVAEQKDMPAIHALESLDEALFRKLLADADDTACGYGPISAAVLFAKSNGAKKGLLLKYGNSGYSTGDFSSVVAYASIAML
ncbi:MAG: AmmeMemoRadiSam system protein B [Candidatus Micrarchaeaceae archaeon]